jgi:hypothetical protein
MDIPLHHLLRQLRDEGWSWHDIAIAFPHLGLDPAVDHDAMASAAARHVIRAAAGSRRSSEDPLPALGFVVPWQLQDAS